MPVIERINTCDSVGVLERIARTTVLWELGCRTINILIVILEGHIVSHIVYAQQKAEVVRRIVIILKVDHFSDLSLQV